MKAVLTAVRLCFLAGILLIPTGRFSVQASEPAGWQSRKAPLMTRWADQVGPDNVWPEYPRPQLVRPDWVNLNGLWDYAISPGTVDTAPAFTGRIPVRYRPTAGTLPG